MALKVHDLTVSLGHQPIIERLAMQLEPGVVTAIVGPNGSGKSTLLRSLARLIPVQTGDLALGPIQDGFALSRKQFARHLALLAQQTPTPAGLTVREVVWFGRYPHRSPWRGADPAGEPAVAQALELTGLTDLAEATMETLSGGQLQRTWIASALAQRTGILLLDEPTNHLDLRYQVDILNLIGELADQQHTAIGLVLHDLNHAAFIADRMVLLDHGRIAAEGDPAEVLEPERLSSVYATPLRTTRDPGNGRITLQPEGLRRRST